MYTELKVHVLCDLTYMLPVKNVNVNPTFMLFEVCSFQTTGIGITKIAMSVRIFGKEPQR